MTDQLTVRIRAAADEAMRDVRVDDPRSGLDASPAAPVRSIAGRGSSGGPAGGRRGRLTAAAGIAAAVVVGVFIWLGGRAAQEPADPSPRPEVGTPDLAPTAREQLIAAVDATRAAAAWSAEVTGGVVETFWVYESPDRIEMKTAGAAGDWASQSVTVGTDMYVLDDGEWTLVQQDWRTAAPFNLLDGVRSAECVARDDDAVVVYWAPSTEGCGAPAGQMPEDLPLNSEVGRVELDGTGRVQRIRSAEVLEVDGQRMIRPDPGSDDLLARVGAAGGVIATFRYDGVAPVTIPPRR